MRKSTLIKFKLFQVAFNTVIFVAVFSFALIFGKLLEGITVLLSYFLLRYKFDKTFHHANMWVCMALSITMCWIMIAVTLPLSVSILSSVIIAMLDCYILYKVKHYYDMSDKIKELTTPKPFSVDTCTREELLARCAELHFSKKNTELAIMFFIDKIKQSEIADKLCVDEKSVTTRKKRMKIKLNNK